MARAQHTVTMQQHGGYANKFGNFLERFLVAVCIFITQFAGRYPPQIVEAMVPR